MTRRWGPDQFRSSLAQAVESVAEQALAASTTPGLAVALVHRGQVVRVAGHGVADRRTGRPVTAGTRFQAASLSKPVAAWGVLRLVESGRIGLDEPVTGWLRRWRPPPSASGTEGVTVRRLLSHTAGLSVHGYVGQAADRPLPPIEASLAGRPATASRSSCWRRPAGAGCTRVAATACSSCWSRSSPAARSPTTCGPGCWSPRHDRQQLPLVADRGDRPPARRRRRPAARLRLRRAGRRRPRHHRTGPRPLRRRARRPARRAAGTRRAQPGDGAAGPHRRPRDRGPLGAWLWPGLPAVR